MWFRKRKQKENEKELEQLRTRLEIIRVECAQSRNSIKEQEEEIIKICHQIREYLKL